ncbi:hypothetical protein [Magnetococcus sp. PR-3]|uniref:hypothetical protein n=1 Tax=Magnetococcus sp. PR-3 TaxID=3120355 RepID=UPI002FCE5CD9
MRTLIKLFTALLMLSSVTAHAGSQASFPTGWENWPVLGEGTILGQSSKIPASLPPIVISTVETYNWVNDGAGSSYDVRIVPSKPKRAESYEDGPTAVLNLKDIKVLLVTEHFLGEAQYGAFTYDGKDITAAHPSLDPKVCQECHSGFSDYCQTGMCNMR